MKKGRFKSDRLKEAMKLRGIHNNADLARFLKVNPQTSHKWFSGGTANIGASDVFLLADKLKVSTRWLMGLVDDPTPGLTLGPEERRVLALFKELRGLADPSWCDDWVEDGYKTLSRLGVKSEALPYIAKKPVKIPH